MERQQTINRKNLLGEIRAESDQRMLTAAFLETPDYRTLIEESSKVIVIGRRGTGKSALAIRLTQFFRAQPKDHVIELSTTSDQIIGIADLLKNYGDKYNEIKTATNITWQCLLISTVLRSVSGHFKFSKLKASGEIKELLRTEFPNIELGRQFRSLLSAGLQHGASAGERIANLAETLQLGRLRALLTDVLLELRTPVHLIIDRIDEGYEPESINIALIAGIAQGTIDVNSIYDSVHPILFIRDNIFRTIQQRDPDYSRNIEGTSLRLHWDEYQLFRLVCKRLRTALPQLRVEPDGEHDPSSSALPESDIKIWNAVTSRGVDGKDGFRQCLRLTLYRPRDLLALLNEAFGFAMSQDRSVIIDSDLQSAATDISKTRLDDLEKEYDEIFPGLKYFIDVFRGSNVELTADEAKTRLGPVYRDDVYPPGAQQQIALSVGPDDALRDLYSIGFFGVKDDTSGAFKFCHDGRSPDLTLNPQSRMLIHPCYWIAMNLKEQSISENMAQEIHDDYEIEILSHDSELRPKRIGQVISALMSIPPGKEGAQPFHDWCLNSLRIIFAGRLRNIEKHPNGNALQRRDIVASNPGESGFWARVMNDYGSRQVLFEVKNYAELKPEDYRQVATYLNGEYGKLGFIIYRATDKDVRSDNQLKWIREISWTQESRLIVLLSVKWITDLLSKVRSPQKHDAVDKTMNKILDNYARNYLQHKA